MIYIQPNLITSVDGNPDSKDAEKSVGVEQTRTRVQKKKNCT